MIRVYKFAARAPRVNDALVRAQLLAAYRYRSLLAAIERGRRAATRAFLATPEVVEAESVLRAATRSTRKAARKALAIARKSALAAHMDELLVIKERDGEIRRQARAHTDLYWGSYLLIEAAADAARQTPLYDEDLLDPRDPATPRWSGMRADAPGGQLGVQLQHGLSCEALMAGIDRRAWIRIESRHRSGDRAVLGMRIGSVGRDPVWTEVPILLHSGGIPPGATITWIKLSCRPGIRGEDIAHERWTLEVTCELADGTPSRVRRHERAEPAKSGVLAVELCWDQPGDDMVVARYRGSDGARGTLVVPSRCVRALEKVASIQAVRDTLRERMLPEFVRALGREPSVLPGWLRPGLGAASWKSPYRLHQLVRRWREERCDLARPAYEVLQTWELRDEHLWSYQEGARGGALRHRLDVYRTFARRMRERYAVVVVPDRDLSREARWGDDSDRRFIAAPSELRGCLELAFGPNAMELRWQDDDPDSDEPTWIERALATGASMTARDAATIDHGSTMRGGAWASRKSAKRARHT